MKELEGRAGIITGGSSGIGLAMANALAEAGAAVYIISRSGKTKEGYEESIKGTEHIKGDISDFHAMEKICQELAARHGGHLDFLINNAGATFKCLAQDFPEEEFNRIINVNVACVFRMSQICYPFLKNSPYKGRIVNISSMSAHLGFSQVVPYCTSKAAVCGMTRGLAVEWAEDGICVNSIAPGWFHSKMLDDIMDEERGAKILGRMPMHKLGHAEDLGALARLLIGPNGSYITGQDYALDGGALAYGY
ncbi:SDR family NAD(P)-dependent oxidoreductase [Lacrimispora indolis]|uniref:SDR family NAD(P)-dependent oxidoreductase n=1 Tax=Lacrimispora indolis TaxID=69825 RepID=UPI00045E8A89|nr:SDR family oxidoreductase [Lacrimispora indolis]MBE7720590.1 SDR family oxidoreductase [Lacrimispora celerecrescens]